MAVRNGGSVILSETTETYGAEHLFPRRAVSREVGEKLALDDVRSTTVTLTVDGSDGFRLAGSSPMTKISRDPEDLAAQTSTRMGSCSFWARCLRPSRTGTHRGRASRTRWGTLSPSRPRNSGNLSIV